MAKIKNKLNIFFTGVMGMLASLYPAALQAQDTPEAGGDKAT